MKRNKIFAVVLAFVFCFGVFQTPVHADKTIEKINEEKKELEEKKKQVEEQEKAAEGKLNEVIEEKKSITDEITALDKKIQESEQQLGYIHERLDKTNAEHAQTTEDLAIAEQERAEQYDALKKRMKYIHENGKVGYYQVLFSSRGFGDFLNRTEYVNDIVSYDQNMYGKLQEVESTIAEKKAQIEIQIQEIEVLLMEEEEKMLKLEESKEAKKKLMAEVEANVEKYNQQIAELEAESKSIEKKIQEAQAKANEIARQQAEIAAAANRSSGVTKYNTTSGSGEAPSGQFGWPVVGNYRLSSGYVNRVNPISGKREFHTGIDIPAPQGTSILAAESGTIIMSSWNGGYGNCVVIDHGNGVSTLYGHNSSLVASVGDYVNRGDVIAKCGSTGMSTGPHCHFEVRINGSPVRPNGYVGLE